MVTARWSRPTIAVVTVLLTAALTVACGAAPPPATPPGELARDVDLSGQRFTVGGKEFDEQLVLCKMTIAALQSAGATVTDACAVTGSANVRARLTGGAIDMYWEYTGTAWRTYLGQQASIDDPDRLFAAVAAGDVGNDVAWLARTPFDDAYGIGVRSDVADRLGVRTLSDLAALARANRPEASLCVAEEFAGREDGLVGLLRAYGFTLADGRLHTLDLPDIYPALAAGSPCVFGEVGTTDGRINGLRIATLADDRGYFLPYNAALTVRTDVLDRAPGVREIAARLAPTLTEAVIRRLNERVSSEGVDPDTVARDFLRERRLIGG